MPADSGRDSKEADCRLAAQLVLRSVTAKGSIEISTMGVRMRRCLIALLAVGALSTVGVASPAWGKPRAIVATTAVSPSVGVTPLTTYRALRAAAFAAGDKDGVGRGLDGVSATMWVRDVFGVRHVDDGVTASDIFMTYQPTQRFCPIRHN